jgi:putative ABC transport system substrate-binding protein
MRTHRLIAPIAFALVCLAAAAGAQTAKVYRIGFVASGNYTQGSASQNFADTIVRVLGQRGYVLGTNLQIEQRGAEMQYERLPALVAELLARKVDLIVTNSYPAAAAAKRATSTVPIVIIGAGDPVKTSLVASLARPGGNITGLSDVAAELAPKRLGLLREAVPTLRRVAMLWNASDLGMTMRYEASATVAKDLGVVVQSLGVREPDDFETAFAAMTSDPPDGILMVSDALTFLNRKRVYDFALARRLPAIYEGDQFVRSGGLMSYGPDVTEGAERAAYLIDRILKGTSPADLPLEQPTRFRLAINLKTAMAIGLIMPPALLGRADEVLE